ncbi:uncharacterized protein [Phaseolus vulgaris]|uniref:uncharacterized protein n=1 Tax=Phaseolus vulgaris TaxID=3885 RepID=UPI0035CB6DEE
MIQETLKVLRITTYGLLGNEFLEVLRVNTTETWITPYKRYLVDGLLPVEPMKAKIVKRNARQYTLIDGNLFRHGYTHPILTCVCGDQCVCIMVEVHEGICDSHIGGRALSLKVIRVGYYWPIMKEDCVKYAQHCVQCQKHANWWHAATEELRSIYSLWHFHRWGIDILGPFPLAIRQMKYLIVAIEYFTKWIEAE